MPELDGDDDDDVNAGVDSAAVVRDGAAVSVYRGATAFGRTNRRLLPVHAHGHHNYAVTSQSNVQDNITRHSQRSPTLLPTAA